MPQVNTGNAQPLVGATGQLVLHPRTGDFTVTVRGPEIERMAEVLETLSPDMRDLWDRHTVCQDEQGATTECAWTRRTR